MPEDKYNVGHVLRSPSTGEEYEVTALGKRYLLVEVKTAHSSHEFPRRYDEVAKYEVVRAAPLPECGALSPIEFHSAGHFHPDAIVCSAKQAEALQRELAEKHNEAADAWNDARVLRIQRDDLQTKLAAVSATQTLSVPEGMKCVPTKPTPNMLDVADTVWGDGADHARLWTAMVEAAPTLPYAVSTSGALVSGADRADLEWVRQCAEMRSDSDVLIRSAAGEEVFNVGDLRELIAIALSATQERGG